MQAVGPAPARHRAAGELVNDDDLATLDDVLDVTLVQRVRAQRRVEVVQQADVLRVIQAATVAQQACAGEQLLDMMVTDLGQVHLLLLLVDPEIAADPEFVALVRTQRTHFKAEQVIELARRAAAAAGATARTHVDRYRACLAVAPDLQLHALAGFRARHRGEKLLGAHHRRAGRADDHVADGEVALDARGIDRGDDATALGRLLAVGRLEQRHQLVDRQIQLGAFLGRTGDDQRRTGLVDQDRVDLVDDRELETALHAVLEPKRQIVAQVVEAVFVVGAVGDVARVRGTLFFLRLTGANHADGHAEEAVDRAHPVRVAAGEVVVHGDDVRAAALERVQVHRQRRHQRLALARAHLGDLALVQRQATDELHVEVAHAQRAARRLANDGERLGHHVVERLAALQAGAKLRRLRTERLVGQRLQRRLEARCLGHDPVVLAQQSLVAAAENSRKQLKHVVVLDCSGGRSEPA